VTRNTRKINPDLPATAISFDKDTLDLLKAIAAADDRSLASLVRLAVSDWLQSPKGREMAQTAKAPKAENEQSVVVAELAEKISKPAIATGRSTRRMLSGPVTPKAETAVHEAADKPVVTLDDVMAKLAELEARVNATPKFSPEFARQLNEVAMAEVQRIRKERE
jgi:hypothetical protein